MGLKREKIDLSEERRILAALITSTELLNRLGAVVQARAFESSFARTICGWVLEFHKITSQAPGAALMDIYAKKKPDIRDEDEADLVTEFLQNLSRDWVAAEPTNIVYMEKVSTEYFKIRSLDHLKTQLETAVNDRNFGLGEKLVAEYRRVEAGQSQSVDILRDVAPILTAFSIENELLFKFRGPLGQVLGNFHRGDFIAYMGPPKRGKTWWLMHTAITASMYGLKTLFISVEMLKDQTIRRMWTALSGQPIELPYDGKITYPGFIQEGDRYTLAEQIWDGKVADISAAGVTKIQKDIGSSMRWRGSLRLEFGATGSFSVRDLRTMLTSMEIYDGWVPDVVVLDYADVMRSDTGEKEERHRLNAIWQALRGLAQEKNICLFTASQTGRGAMKGKDAKEFDVAEDMRKTAHVTKLITINATNKEKERGIYRLACPLTREGSQSFDQAVVTACLAIGRPYMDARLLSKCDLPADE